jgi:hypothetical protein
LKSRKNALIKAGLLVVLCSWLIFTAYWFFKSLAWVEYAYPYRLTTYLVVDVATSMGLGFRMVAGLVAIWAVVGLLMGREISRLVKLIGLAVVLEALFFLTFLPSAFLGFELGGPFFLVESAIPCLVMATILPVSLFKLKSKITQSTKHYGGAIKWGCIAGISYLIVFWLNFTTQWIGTFIQPESWTSTYPGYEINAFIYPGYGINYIIDHPLNLFSFLLTSVGLLALTIFFSWSVLPTIRDPTKRPNLRKMGAALTFLGAYFIIVILFFIIFGHVGGRSIWTMWFIYNNLDVWCVALPALGIPLMLGKAQLT